MSLVSGSQHFQQEKQRRVAIGGRLRSLRKQHGLTQKELGRQINTGVAALSDVENGTHVMAHTQEFYVRLIADHFKVDYREIVDGTK